MRVLSVIKGLGRGGAEQLVLEQTRATAPPIELHIAYTLQGKGDLVHDLELAGATVHRAFGEGGSWPTHLRRVLADVDPAVVHCHSPLPAVLLRLLTARNGPPTVYTEHNVWPRFHVATRLANAATYGLDAHRFAVSAQVADSVASRWRASVEVLHHGIDVAGTRRRAQPSATTRAALGLPLEGVVVATVANTRPKKDLPTLLRAAASVAAEHADVTFVHVGSGPEAPALHSLRDELRLGERFRFLGKRDDAVDIIAAADIFCLSSLHEGLPVTVMEALAVGTPVVATAVGGLPEAIEDGREGRLVRSGDPAALAAALGALIRDESARSAASSHAAQAAMRFDAAASVRRMEAVYQLLAATDHD